jgi:hypothetical protein
VSYPYFSLEKSFEFAEFGVEAAIVLKVWPAKRWPGFEQRIIDVQPRDGGLHANKFAHFVLRRANRCL